MNLIDAQMSRVYGNNELMADLRALLNSSSQNEYFTRRLLNSTSSRNFIRSFPEELGSFLLRYNISLRHVTVMGENTCNWVTMVDKRPFTRFNIGDENFPASDFGGCIEIRYTVYDPGFEFAPAGELGFWFDVATTIKSSFAHGGRWFAITDADENLLYISDDNETNRASIENVKELEKGGKKPSYLPFDKLYTVDYSFLKSQYKFYACINESVLVLENAGVLAFTIAVFILLGGVFLVFYYYNLMDDTRFLNEIFNSINAVKRGDFSVTEHKKRTDSNEYGMIANELDDMSRELQEHIVSGLHLKIKQQDAEMRALQHQINPHFLYNVLEVIRARSLVNKDSATADAIADLGSIYRSVVKTVSECTIGDELELLKKYFKLMGYRYPENFISQITVDQALLDVPTVKFWMQPLAENFFVHGFNNGSGPVPQK